ncbi:MAG: DNA-directed RNA polymerase subunit beta' [Dehalococcoidia bacterium]|nr:DNA-directed RNA polymerase subunit beta' [Dehalococcoidia bacterium]
MAQAGNEFNAIRISLASPEQIRAWSYGEVTKPETINYRTLRPEKDGLFCERIFGPTKDWECYCGKYKKIRYKGVICDRCGVEVARSKVRRERMGHIKLAAPVAHIWFSKGTPSRLGLLMDLSPRNLERVLYFAQYIVTHIDEDARRRAIETLGGYQESELKRLDEEGDSPAPEASGEKPEGGEKPLTLDQKKAALEKDVRAKIEEVESINLKDLLTEARYRELRDRFGEVFRAGMGAESVLEVLKKTSLETLRDELQDLVKNTSGQRRKKAIKRLRVVESFRKSGNKPEWMVLTVLPVLPPELHPMVQLDGGRFATSDLNDLYRRVINRNNRLKHLIELQAPDIIVRNEKRMLQEAVDALIDNGRRGRAIQGSHNHKLKSLTDLLRGKQGRFRQNLLGKRVDYSGRSVIISGPNLKMHQCGLPKRMALELFKPFVMNALVVKGYAHNIKSAKRMAERARPEIWDILEEVIQNHPVLLNRAPTLHRLGIQAFQPILVDGSAIQIHPLVCTAFNADFDGDQMAVHVPLSREAILESQRVMLSTHNMLAPSSGEPIVSPTLDMVLGMYYLTEVEPAEKGVKLASFADFEDALLAHSLNRLPLRKLMRVRDSKGEWVETSAGRIIFNSALPEGMDFRNHRFAKKEVGELVSECHETYGNQKTADVLDRIKDLGFRYATQSGTTIAISDIVTPPQKQSLLSAADGKVDKLEGQFQEGLITTQERYQATVEIWSDVSTKMEAAVKEMMPKYGGIFTMQDSGAKGNLAQIKQMAGMRGLMSDPKGRIIELPIRSSFAEGLTVLEYFISTHGARKGLADTALRTADSGYLTRRLADVAQDVIVLHEDCGTRNGIPVLAGNNPLQADLSERLATRHTVQVVEAPAVKGKKKEILAEAGDLLTRDLARKIQKAGVKEIWVRSPLTCEAPRGICQKCYGTTLATGRPSVIGEAVGITAAQSIGEPGTQLTMRTFHTGGVAGADITSGLPRVVELFEARSPRGLAVLSEIGGKVELHQTPDGRVAKVVSSETFTEEIDIPNTHKQMIKTGDWVDAGQPILGVKRKAKAESDRSGTDLAHPDEITAPVSGNVEITKNTITIKWEERDEREYLIPAAAELLMKDGDTVSPGQALTSGPKNPQDILRIEGQHAVQRYMVDEVQSVYRSQGVDIHDKHIETIIRQMLRKVRVDSPGNTDLLPGELIDRQEYERINNRILAEGGEPATASPVLLGVTRASLNTESFLAAASFQETARVLTEAAVNGAVDRLFGLKENVIIGRLIPARLDRTEAGRKVLGLDDLPFRPDGQLTGVTQAPATFEEALAAIGGRDIASVGTEDVRAAASALRGSRGSDAQDDADAAARAARRLMESTSGSAEKPEFESAEEDDDDDDDEGDEVEEDEGEEGTESEEPEEVK